MTPSLYWTRCIRENRNNTASWTKLKCVSNYYWKCSMELRCTVHMRLRLTYICRWLHPRRILGYSYRWNFRHCWYMWQECCDILRSLLHTRRNLHQKPEFSVCCTSTTPIVNEGHLSHTDSVPLISNLVVVWKSDGRVSQSLLRASCISISSIVFLKNL